MVSSERGSKSQWKAVERSCCLGKEPFKYDNWSRLQKEGGPQFQSRDARSLLMVIEAD